MELFFYAQIISAHMTACPQVHMHLQECVFTCMHNVCMHLLTSVEFMHGHTSKQKMYS